jgi:4-hydroxy-4-methyl-2-oxoglutarate aldolase
MRDASVLEQVTARLFTGVLSDVLDSIGRREQVADADFVHVVPGVSVVGWAQTARAVSVTEPPREPYKLLLEAIDLTTAGRVLVLGSPATSASALFGGLLAGAVRSAGGAGVVVDGYARDSDEVRASGLPTMVRGFRPLDSYGREEVVEISEPVTVGGVTVRQGDLVFGDNDGLVCVPAEVEAEVLQKAFAKVEAEGEMRAALASGMSVRTAFATFGVL